MFIIYHIFTYKLYSMTCFAMCLPYDHDNRDRPDAVDVSESMDQYMAKNKAWSQWTTWNTPRLWYWGSDLEPGFIGVIYFPASFLELKEPRDRRASDGASLREICQPRSNEDGGSVPCTFFRRCMYNIYKYTQYMCISEKYHIPQELMIGRWNCCFKMLPFQVTC